MKTIALVDWNWTGHHPMYFLKLVEGFIEIGCRVAAFCPEAAIDEVSKATAGIKNVTIDTCRYVHPRHRVPKCLRTREHARRVFGVLNDSLSQWEKHNGTKIDLIFFASIYDLEFENIGHAKSYFKRPWSGIYLHARAFRMPGSPMPFYNRLPCPEKIFTNSSLSSVCLLDEGAVKPMQALTMGKPAFEFPDFTATEVEIPLNGTTLAGKLLRFAAGRKIVVCLGHLQKTKGLLELCQAARDPRSANICFFFGGEVSWSDFSKKEISFIQSTWEQCPHVLTHLARIVSDATINALMKASDVVFAAYTNFPNSSNTMTKAAFLERPLIVSEGYLMSERVLQYRLGATVPEGSTEEIIQQILRFCDRGGDPNADYPGFYAKHSPTALQAALAKVVDAASACGTSPRQQSQKN